MIMISVIVLYGIIGIVVTMWNLLDPTYIVLWPIVAISWLYHILKAKPKESIEQWCQRCMYNGIRSPNACALCMQEEHLGTVTLSNFKMLQMNKRLLNDTD